MPPPRIAQCTAPSQAILGLIPMSANHLSRKNSTWNFLQRPSPCETSDVIHLFAFLHCRHMGVGVWCSFHFGPTLPPHPILSTPWAAPTSAIKKISLSYGGEVIARSSEGRSDAAKGGVDPALGLSVRTRRQRAQRRSEHTSTTTATSTRRLAAEHRGCCRLPTVRRP